MFKPGDRVQWKSDLDEQTLVEPVECGTVKAPTEEEQIYFDACSASFRASLGDNPVVVIWDQDQEWEATWCNPNDLQRV